MAAELSVLRERVRVFATRFDASALTPASAAQVVEDAAAIEAMASTVKSLAAARAVEVGVWEGVGYRSAAEGLARQTGTTIRAAQEALETGRRLSSHPAVGEAARSGAISAAQATLVANAAEADPGAAGHLLDAAREGSLAELRQACAQVKALACADPEEHRRAIHAARELRAYTDVEGVWHLVAAGNPEQGAQIMAALAPRSDSLLRAAWANGGREPAPAYAFDALVALATEHTTADRTDQRGTKRRRHGAPVKLLVRIDYDTWLRGVPVEGETCELVGYGPIAVSAVRDLLATGDPFVAAILMKGKALVGVAHLGRKPNAYQQSALEWLYPSCAVLGCAAQRHLERDHRVEWAKTHYTVLDLMDEFCGHHHWLKTHEGWSLVEGTGKRAFVPPDDPRHPLYGRLRC